jgi:acyl-CoA thioesterase FadM
MIAALLSRSRHDALSMVTCHFRITPFDCGASVLKSDKYFQLAESAQLDYLIRTGLFTTLRADGLSFVNASQLIKFTKPVGVFKRVRVETKISYADEKFAYFSHAIFLGSLQCSEVLVKMKFKKGSLTVPPSEIIGKFELGTPRHLQTWNQTLEAMC